jgi:hypothetical protein
MIRGSTRVYTTRHPGQNDIGLVIEVAETTLDRDRIPKKRKDRPGRASVPGVPPSNDLDERLLSKARFQRPSPVPSGSGAIVH